MKNYQIPDANWWSELHDEAVSYPQTERKRTPARMPRIGGDGIPRIDWDEWTGQEVDRVCGQIFSK